MRLGSKLVAVCLSLLFSLGVAEALVRTFYRDQVDSNLLRERQREGSIAHLIQPTNSPGLIYELKPNNSARLLASQINTGPDGYRIDPQTAPPAADAKRARVAFLGDSTSFGWGVEYRQSYPELVRTRLEPQLGRSIDLRNYSVPGYNSEQEVALLLQRVVPYRPDVLFLHHDPNDSDPVGFGFNMPPDYLAPEYGDNLLSSALLKLASREVRLRKNHRAFEYDNQATVLQGNIVGGSLYERHLKALESIASTSKTLGIPVVAILFDGRVVADDRYEDSELYEKVHRSLQQRMEAMGFMVLDLFPFYQATMKREGWKDLTPVWRFPGDAHPNPAGHRLIADALTEYVMSHPELIGRLK